jgi:hypothetical protein
VTDEVKIIKLRAQLRELGSSVRQVATSAIAEFAPIETTPSGSPIGGAAQASAMTILATIRSNACTH